MVDKVTIIKSICLPELISILMDTRAELEYAAKGGDNESYAMALDMDRKMERIHDEFMLIYQDYCQY